MPDDVEYCGSGSVGLFAHGISAKRRVHDVAPRRLEVLRHRAVVAGADVDVGVLRDVLPERAVGEAVEPRVLVLAVAGDEPRGARDVGGGLRPVGLLRVPADPAGYLVVDLLDVLDALALVDAEALDRAGERVVPRVHRARRHAVGEVAHTGEALRGARRLRSRAERRHENRRQDTYDRHHHEQLNQRKRASHVSSPPTSNIIHQTSNFELTRTAGRTAPASGAAKPRPSTCAGRARRARRRARRAGAGSGRTCRCRASRVRRARR